MKVCTYICDHCGAKIEETQVHYAIGIMPICPSGSIDKDALNFNAVEDALSDKDFCGSCIAEMINNFVYQKVPMPTCMDADAEGQDAEESVEEETDPKKELDAGKCYALRKAGWTYKNIAEEFGGRYTMSQIRNAVRNYENNMEG